MEAKDVQNLRWKKVTDWSGLAKSHLTLTDTYVSKTDMDIFVENIYKDISRKLNCPYEDLKPILENKNELFYVLKNELFTYRYGFTEGDSLLIILQNMLKVPYVEATVTENTADDCLKLFESLSDLEKLDFLQKIGKD